MLNIPEELKNYFLSDSVNKRLFISIPKKPYTGEYNRYNGRYSNEVIYFEEFSLKESVMDKNAEIVGCMASEMSVKIQMLDTSVRVSEFKGLKISASIAIILDVADDGTETLSQEIPLFSGYINDAKKDADRKFIKFTGYDVLSYLNDTLIYNIYKRAFKKSYNPNANRGIVTVKDFRDYIIEQELGLNQVSAELPNDMVKIKKRSIKKDMTALTMLKNICQINGCYGIISREGKFEYKFIKPDSELSNQEIPYYRNLTYDQTYISIFENGITIKTNSKDSGVTVDWSNYTKYTTADWDDDTADTYIIDSDDEDVTEGMYIIECNLIAYKLSKAKKLVMGANILSKIGNKNNAVFRKFNAKCNGLPFIECGDKVTFTNVNGNKISFIVTSRTLQGIQAMTDTYECSPKMEYSADNVVSTDASIKTNAGSYVSNVNTGYGGVIESAIDTSNSDIALTGKEVMVVVSWDENTGILETTSTTIQDTYNTESDD